jgi:NADPH:quinone reductase-like Zn-dependent oxidoreductase
MVRSIGADHVVDYTEQDFTRSGQRCDVILAVGGYHPIMAYMRALSGHGTYVCTGGSWAQYSQALFFGPLISLMGSRKMGVVFPRANREDLSLLTELFEAGKVTPVIDGHYTLSEVPEALQYFGEGKARGKIVITVGQDNET